MAHPVFLMHIQSLLSGYAPATYSPTHPSIYPSIHLSIHLSIYPGSVSPLGRCTSKARKVRIIFLSHSIIIGVFDFMQRHADRSAADLKQCMLVRKFVQLELAPTPRHCHVWHQSTAIAFREQPADSTGAMESQMVQNSPGFHRRMIIKTPFS